jgi:hypothetical protein
MRGKTFGMYILINFKFPTQWHAGDSIRHPDESFIAVSSFKPDSGSTLRDCGSHQMDPTIHASVGRESPSASIETAGSTSPYGSSGRRSSLLAGDLNRRHSSSSMWEVGDHGEWTIRPSCDGRRFPVPLVYWQPSKMTACLARSMSHESFWRFQFSCLGLFN